IPARRVRSSHTRDRAKARCVQHRLMETSTMIGNAYPKPAWAPGEQPVASAKLNPWDNRIEAAVALGCLLLHHAWGGVNGVVSGATEDDLLVAETDPASMSVSVPTGYAMINGEPFHLAAPIVAGPVTAPATHPRIDIVQ